MRRKFIMIGLGVLVVLLASILGWFLSLETTHRTLFQEQPQEPPAEVVTPGQQWLNEMQEQMPCFRENFVKLLKLNTARDIALQKEKNKFELPPEKSSTEIEVEMRTILLAMFGDENCCQDFYNFWMAKLQELRDFNQSAAATEVRQDSFDPPPEAADKINLQRIFQQLEEEHLNNTHRALITLGYVKNALSKTFFGKQMKIAFGSLENFLASIGPCSARLQQLITQMRKFTKYQYARTGVADESGQPAFPEIHQD